MATRCPSSADLILAALEAGQASTEADLAGHIGSCAECRAQLTVLREVVTTLRTSGPERPTDEGCLDPHDLARLADGADSDADRAALAHLVSCAECRAQLSAALSVLRDSSIAAEIERLESTVVPAPRRSRFALAGSVAAAVLLGVLLWPEAASDRRFVPVPEGEMEGGGATTTTAAPRVATSAGGTSSTDSPVSPGVPRAGIYRERAITSTAAPRIVGPIGAATSTDSLVWTSVPGADLYRATFWRTDGSMVWEGETRDTVLALPALLLRSGERSLFWEVKARTGWDRWVVSELVHTTLDSAGGSSR